MNNISTENAMPCHFNFFMLPAKKRSALLISVICRQDLSPPHRPVAAKGHTGCFYHRSSSGYLQGRGAQPHKMKRTKAVIKHGLLAAEKSDILGVAN